ncbi:MAG TPA: hypothetical protein VIV15_17705, partial [Anaerolineales bacterium]
GNFTINQYAGLHVSREGVSIEYLVDMAEIPAFQEIAIFDVNGDGKADPTEAEAYHHSKCLSLAPELELSVDGRQTALVLASSAVEFPAGAGGLATLRLTCDFRGSISSLARHAKVTFETHAYAERLGWRRSSSFQMD